MPGYRKLGRTSSQRKAMLRNLATQLIYHGKITTTETRAKEVRKIAEKLITLAVKEKDNFTTEEVMVKVPQKDSEGKRVKTVENGRKVTEYSEVERTIKKDAPTRLAARRKILSVLYPVTQVPADGRRKRSESKKVDIANLMFDKWAPKYSGRNGGYTRMIKIGPRRGDAAPMVLLEMI
ncbi:MAG: 50S ribosomal protein L17 [Defluviitaleaceae bacterium]|nr:50S ribosomal protein L17 [Defluviitaleaceae bacterium]MCL2262711.1 50S ribosomal protein L17 [Defluviitaleaceae bacterium]